MITFVPGSVARLESLDFGSLVLFNLGQVMHIGLIIDGGESKKYILDFDGEDKNQQKQFMAYPGHHFANEDFLHITSGRIRPTLAEATMGYGAHSGGKQAKALYLSFAGTVVFAMYETGAYAINLDNGSIVPGFIETIHSTSWRIEAADGAGNFEVLRKFAA